MALTLRLLGGLTTDEIARAYLVPEPTIAQRIVRAKRTLAKEQVAFEIPRGAERAARLSSVLEVIYLIFNEGYTATAGDDWMRPGLCEDALRLARVLAGLDARRARSPRPRRAARIPGVALAGARERRGRTDPAARSEPRALGSHPDRPRPRRARARRTARRQRRSVRAAGRDRRRHARGAPPPATPTGRTSPRSTRSSPRVSPSPVVELNRAVAVSMAFGPQAGLAIVDTLVARARWRAITCCRA